MLTWNTDFPIRRGRETRRNRHAVEWSSELQSQITMVQQKSSKFVLTQLFVVSIEPTEGKFDSMDFSN